MQAFEERFSPRHSRGEQNIRFHSERVSKKLEKTNIVIYLLILVLLTAILLSILITTFLPKNQAGEDVDEIHTCKKADHEFQEKDINHPPHSYIPSSSSPLYSFTLPNISTHYIKTSELFSSPNLVDHIQSELHKFSLLLQEDEDANGKKCAQEGWRGKQLLNKKEGWKKELNEDKKEIGGNQETNNFISIIEEYERVVEKLNLEGEDVKKRRERKEEERRKWRECRDDVMKEKDGIVNLEVSLKQEKMEMAQTLAEVKDVEGDLKNFEKNKDEILKRRQNEINEIKLKLKEENKIYKFLKEEEHLIHQKTLENQEIENKKKKFPSEREKLSHDLKLDANDLANYKIELQKRLIEKGDYDFRIEYLELKFQELALRRKSQFQNAELNIMTEKQNLLNMEKNFNFQKFTFSESERTSKQEEFDREKNKLLESIKKRVEEVKVSKEEEEFKDEKEKEEKGRRIVVLRIEELERLIMETERRGKKAEERIREIDAFFEECEGKWKSNDEFIREKQKLMEDSSAKIKQLEAELKAKNINNWQDINFPFNYQKLTHAKEELSSLINKYKNSITQKGSLLISLLAKLNKKISNCKVREHAIKDNIGGWEIGRQENIKELEKLHEKMKKRDF